MNPDKQLFQEKSIRWLFEMELLDDPRTITTMKMNIFTYFPRIKEVEFLVLLPPKREMLVYLEVGWFVRRFRSERYTTEIADLLRTFVPKYNLKVTVDLAEFEAARARVKLFLQKQNEIPAKVVNHG